MFRFDRAGRRKQNSLKRGNGDAKKRWHRKHSLHGDDLKKFLKGQNKAPQLSEKMQAKLKGMTIMAKKKVKNKPVTAVYRDTLQPKYMETPLPLQHVNKQDSLTLKAVKGMGEGTFHASVAGFTDALVIEEFHFYARFYRALCYATIGRYRPALSDMSKCTKIVAKMDPADGGFGPGCDPPERLRFVCYFNLALLHLNVHEHRAAVKCLNVAEMAQPHSPDAAFLRGFVRRRRGLYLQCRSDYVTASKLKLRQDVGALEASRIEHSFSTEANRTSRHHHASLVRSPPKKSQILSFLTSVQKSLMTPCTDRTQMHLQYIAAMLTPHSFFGKIQETMRMKLCQDIEYRTCEPGEWVFRRGDPSDAFYLCLSGRLNVMVTNPGMATESHGGTLKKGDTFGELGVLHDMGRSASVVVNAAAELCVVPAWLFETVGLRAAMHQVRQDKHAAIVESNILGGLPDHYVRDATDFATIRVYEQGEKLVEQGQHAECVFVILKGICEVWQRIDIRGEMVRRRKTLLDETESLAKRYVYHHQVLYHTVGDSTDPSATGVGEDTTLERKRKRLLRELAQVDATMKQLDREKMKNYRKMSRWKRMMMENNSASKLNAEGAKIKRVRLREIMQPSYFGHGAIRGDGSIEPADVVATTRVKALRIFVPQMDFSKVNDSFLERLSTLSAVRPLGLEELAQRARGEEGWAKYRQHSMQFIGKSKWPLRGEAAVTTGASGTSYIHPLPLPHGYLNPGK
jgi:CRP-like cAMP-binding protein